VTYAVRIKKATGGTGEQTLLSSGSFIDASLSKMEENTHSFILKYFRKEWRVLEAGCGLGRWLIYLSDLGFNVAGIDISSDAINILKKMKPELHLSIGDISSMPYRDGEFDAVLSVGVVEHIKDGPVQALDEMRRITRDDGLLILVVPLENIIRTFFHRPLCFLRYNISALLGIKLEFEEYRFSACDIMNHVVKRGWEIIEKSWVELTPSDRSYSLWVDWGNLFRDKSRSEPFALNALGRLKKRFLTAISPWLNAEGIVISARKTK